MFAGTHDHTLHLLIIIIRTFMPIRYRMTAEWFTLQVAKFYTCSINNSKESESLVVSLYVVFVHGTYHFLPHFVEFFQHFSFSSASTIRVRPTSPNRISPLAPRTTSQWAIIEDSGLWSNDKSGNNNDQQECRLHFF